MAGFARATASAPTSPAAALLTGERLVVFLFAARVALAAPAHLAAPLAILVAAALAVELAVDGSAPLRRFRTRCAGQAAPLPSLVRAVSLPHRRSIEPGVSGIRFPVDIKLRVVNWSEAIAGFPNQSLGLGV
jgi:hypothetical protein